jgi:hypothetical protein
MSPSSIFMLTIVASAAYLGLAVLGWGGFATFFANPTPRCFLTPLKF